MRMFGMEFSDNQISIHDACIQIKTVPFFAILDVMRKTGQSHTLSIFFLEGYSSSHKHGFGKWPYLEGPIVHFNNYGKEGNSTTYDVS